MHVSGSFVKSLFSMQYGLVHYWCRLHRLLQKFKIHQLKHVLCLPKLIEHSFRSLSTHTYTKRIHTRTPLESKDPRAQSLSSINNCVRNSLFYDSVFQLKIRNTSPTFGNGCIQLLRSFFNCMTSSCAQTGEMLLLFHSVMSVNVFVCGYFQEPTSVFRIACIWKWYHNHINGKTTATEKCSLFSYCFPLRS